VIAIEKGIPVPLPGRATRYPWDLLEVGDSFLVTERLKSARVGACIRNKGSEKKFVSRSVEGGLRIWRLA
jgi:hypothetical protein